MLEWIALALLSNDSGGFLRLNVESVQKTSQVIERFDPADLPKQKVEKLSPQFLNDPFLAVFAQDLDSGKVLFDQRADKAQPIASLTKIMTFLVIFENHDLDEVVEVPLEATQGDGANIGLYAYERLTVETLLKAILIPSANDAAVALAIFDSGSEEAFVEKMNQKARALGLGSAQFYNSTGLDIYEQVLECDQIAAVDACEKASEREYGNVMSAEDIALMTRVALNNDFFKATVQLKEFEGASVDEKFFHSKKSTNQLLGTFVNSKGVKTGYTLLAGQCLVNLSEDNAGREILTVVLGSSNRFEETKRLMDWIWSSFVWK